MDRISCSEDVCRALSDGGDASMLPPPTPDPDATAPAAAGAPDAEVEAAAWTGGGAAVSRVVLSGGGADGG